MLMRRVDGAVLMGSEFETKAIDSLLLHRIPMVTVDRRTTQIGCSDVAIDYEPGFVEAVRHLKSLGHRRIGYIGGSVGPYTSKVRAKAFQQAIEKAGLTYYPGLTRCGDYRLKGGEAAILSIFQMPSPPTAIITANDLTAFGAIQGLHLLKRSAPKDLSIIGVDDLELSSVIQPPLTTIRIPRRRLAETCTQAIFQTKNSIEAMGTRFSVATELVVRDSTAPPSAKPRKARKAKR
jgi:LacI family transcriptional regulator